MTSYSMRSDNPAITRTDVMVVGLIQAADGPELAPGAEGIAAAYNGTLDSVLAALGARGKPSEIHKVVTTGRIDAPLLLLIGLGPGEPDCRALRRAAGVASRNVANAASVALALPAATGEQVSAVTEGWLLGGYRFTTYQRDSAPEWSAPESVLVLSPAAGQADLVAAFDRAQSVASAVAQARDWVNEPPGQLTPAVFATAVADAVGRHNETADPSSPRAVVRIDCVVHDEQALAELGCGGILSVGAGSDAPPRLVELTYRPKHAVAHLALVGKGITYDSGGLTIKPAASMATMKYDMSGAAAVVQATLAIAELGLPVQVSTFAPMAENMISGSATRPGDVITMYGGRTVEVTNADAEGRMILADALGRAVEQSPDVVVNVATLTGAMIVALGDRVAGVMGSDEVTRRIVEAGARADEAIWPMPIPDEMAERVAASKIADLLQHDWERWGGGLYAAAFLREFVGEIPWGHLDIAGPAFNKGSAWGHITPGGTGFGVATLIDLAEAYAGGPAADGGSPTAGS
ncbi:MAG: leucyl aminopeptidase [Nocardioides sp.]